jgi:hypothetical protein
MRFQIISGTAIQEFVEQCGSAADALGQVRVLLKAGLRNIRVQDEVGRNYSFTEIEELADDEADADDCRLRKVSEAGDALPENQTRHQ